jgi:hypothetical protein
VAVSDTDYKLFNGKFNENIINRGQDFWYKKEKSAAGRKGALFVIF